MKIFLSNFALGDNGVFTLPSNIKSDFGYSDGDATEEYILSCLRDVTDITYGSSELAGKIKDWPSYYHFAPGRANILRCFEIPDDVKVLELGAGCGAITRFLGERNIIVDAIEGSVRRAQIARERCRDLSNVRVYCSDFSDLNFDKSYDIVTLIGVLEYAPLFGQYVINTSAAMVCQKLLELAQSALKPGGVLIVAIENRIGLKYWSGSIEDHTGMPYEGIYGYPSEKGPVTWNKKELSALLARAGLSAKQWYYCYPDYKFASTIFSDYSHSNGTDFYLHNWISTPFDTPGQFREYKFNEMLATRTLSQAGLLGEFANSFLVVAGSTSLAEQTQWIAKRFSTKRLKKYACVTTLFTKPELHVIKERIYKEDKLIIEEVIDERQTLCHRLNTDSKWYPGDLYVYEFLELFHKNMRNEYCGLNALITQYCSKLIDLFGTGKKDKDGYELVDGTALDFTPRNMIKQGKNLVYFDLEWSLKKPIPIDFMMYRLTLDIGSYVIGNQNKFCFKEIKQVFPQYKTIRHSRNQELQGMVINAVGSASCNDISSDGTLRRFIRSKIFKSVWDYVPVNAKRWIKMSMGMK